MINLTENRKTYNIEQNLIIASEPYQEGLVPISVYTLLSQSNHFCIGVTYYSGRVYRNRKKQNHKKQAALITRNNAFVDLIGDSLIGDIFRDLLMGD